MKKQTDEQIIKEMQDRDKSAMELWSPIHADYNQHYSFTNAPEGQWTENEKDRLGDPCLQVNRVRAYVKRVVNGAIQQDISCDVEPVSEGAVPELAKVRQAQMMKIWENGKGKSAAAYVLNCQISGCFGVIGQTIDFADAKGFNKKINYKALKDPTTFRCDPSARAPALADMSFAIIENQLGKGGFEKRYGTWKDTSPGHSEKWEVGDKKRVFEYWRIVKGNSRLLATVDGKNVDSGDYKNWDERKSTGDDGQEVINNPKPELKMDEGDNPLSRLIPDNVVEQFIIANEKVIKKVIWPGSRLPWKVVEGFEYWTSGKKTYQPMTLAAEGPQKSYNFIESQKAILYSKGPLEMVLVPSEGDSSGLTEKINEATRNGSKNVIVIPFKSVDDSGNRIGQPTWKPQLLGDPMLLQESQAKIADIEACFGMTRNTLTAKPSDAAVSIHAVEAQYDTATFDYIDAWLTALEELWTDTMELIPKLGIAMQVKLSGANSQQEMVWVNNQALAAKTGAKNYDLDEDETYSLSIKAGPNPKSMREKSFEQNMQFAKEFPQLAPLISDLIADDSLSGNSSTEISQRALRFIQHTAPFVLDTQGDPQVQMLTGQLQQAQQGMQQLHQQATQQIGQLTQMNQMNQEKIKLQTAQMGLLKQQMALQKQAGDVSGANSALDGQIRANEQRLEEIRVQTEQYEAISGRETADANMLKAVGNLMPQTSTPKLEQGLA